jgi:hypothetical protein
MKKQLFLFNKQYLFFSFLSGILVVAFALLPQIDLWKTRGDDYHGAYAVIDFDEPFYAAYIQSQKDGKPFKNSPFSGMMDSEETPQKDSYLSIQFLSTYPIAVFSDIFELSISQTMILVTVLCGFLSSFIIFRLFYLFTLDVFSSSVGTLLVLVCGAFAGGQGGIISSILPENVQYANPLLFLRRSNPAISFPILFLFFIWVWEFFCSVKTQTKIVFSILAVGSFAFTVYAYYFHWTTAFAWLFGLLILWAIFRFNDLWRNKLHLFILFTGALAALIPYLIQVSNRTGSTDSSLFLVSTHQPDLFRIPELISYLTIIVLWIAKHKEWINIKDSKILFLLSLALVAPMVFNQQILTGRSLQPFHYEFFCVNYISVLSLTIVCFILLKERSKSGDFRKLLLSLGITVVFFGYFDSLPGISTMREINVRRDELLPVAEKVRSINQNSPPPLINQPTVLLSFDFVETSYLNSIDFPAFGSQAVLWGPHISMFPDISSEENQRRLFKALYYQGFNKERFKTELKQNILLLFSVFNGERVSKIYTGEIRPISNEEIEEMAEKYERFYQSFDLREATTPTLSYILVNKNSKKNDFSIVDQWYNRDGGEIFGNFILYRVKIRHQ